MRTDWAVFRELRLRSLLDSPDAFGSTYGHESSHTERAWRDWAAGRWRRRHRRRLRQPGRRRHTARRFYATGGFDDTGERHPLREGSDVQTLILSKRL